MKQKTLVYALYIIHPSGSPLFSKLFQAPTDAPPTEILSSLLTAFKDIVKDLTKGDAQSFITDNANYHMKIYRGLQVILVTNSVERPVNALNKLGLIFMKDYGYQISTDWKGDVSGFDDFYYAADVVINAYFEFDAALLINPTKKFHTMFLYSLESRLKNTAISLVTLREGTLNEIAEYSEEDPQVVELNLAELQDLGYVGIKRREFDYVYFYLER